MVFLLINSNLAFHHNRTIRAFIHKTPMFLIRTELNCLNILQNMNFWIWKLFAHWKIHLFCRLFSQLNSVMVRNKGVLCINALIVLWWWKAKLLTIWEGIYEKSILMNDLIYAPFAMRLLPEKRLWWLTSKIFTENDLLIFSKMFYLWW